MAGSTPAMKRLRADLVCSAPWTPKGFCAKWLRPPRFPAVLESVSRRIGEMRESWQRYMRPTCGRRSAYPTRNRRPSDLCWLSGRSDRNVHSGETADSGFFADAWVSVSRQDPLDEDVSHLGSYPTDGGDGSDNPSYLSVPVGTTRTGGAQN